LALTNLLMQIRWVLRNKLLDIYIVNSLHWIIEANKHSHHSIYFIPKQFWQLNT